MSRTPRVLAFGGSLRRESWNDKLVRAAARGAESAGAAVTVIRLADYPLPLMDEEVEKASPPTSASELRELFRAHDALLIASPEYNSSVTAVLKNTIDWVSRPEPGHGSLSAFAGKVAGLLAASPGALGGIRGLVHLRAILSNIKVIVVPDQLAVGSIDKVIGPDGSIIDESRRASIEGIGTAVARLSARLLA